MPKIYATDSPVVSDREIRNQDFTRRVGSECIVLLENDGILPLREPQPVALFGAGARHTIRGGTGSGDVNTRSSVSVEDGLRNAGCDITSGAWLSRQDAARKAAEQGYEEQIAKIAAEQHTDPGLLRLLMPFREPQPVPVTDEDIASAPGDIAVYVIARSSGEGSDRGPGPGDYELSSLERDEIAKLAAAYPGLIIVLNVGSVVEITGIAEINGVRAIVLMSQLGSTGGDSLADVLMGKATPSGKLTDTWAKRYQDYPAADTYGRQGGDLDDEYYREGIYVGYRYFDSYGVEPLYPFGYGKSYTTFALSRPTVSLEADEITVTVNVRNTGEAYSGKEVVQVYCSAPISSRIGTPYQSLVAFAKTSVLAPGASETLQMRFRVQDLASFDTDSAAWTLQGGAYILRVGTSSRDTSPAAVLVAPSDMPTEQLRTLFTDPDPVKEDPAPKFSFAEIPHTVPRISIDHAAVFCAEATYEGVREPYTTTIDRTLTADDVRRGECTVEELTAQLTVQQMADLCVGTFRATGSIVGNASHAVAGAAGDTSSVLEQSRGIRGLIMADGPAGLRLTPVFHADSSGRLLPDSEDEQDAMTYYQYCTAIPIGTALAQSWNVDLIEDVGRMISEEMEEFGVDIWLAPAMNIHRNPLCGRNFEYYSEDPLVTGQAAAAMTRGVQSRPNKAATIKHFAVNNQEDNRYFTNAHVSEQALREIYLKGFEIAVRGAAPIAIMTSYNLLNGVHTANDYDLLQYACRDEWGFSGLIMTDWFTSVDMPQLTGGRKTKYPISSSTGCIYASNDLQMPGSEKNVEDITEGVETGQEVDRFRISLADLQHCAARVISTVIRLTD